MPRLVRDGEPTNPSTPAVTAVVASAAPTPTQTKPALNNSGDTTVNKAVVVVKIPPPPPGVPEIQLRVWNVALSRRMQQLRQLSPQHLSGFAREIRDDFMTSRYGSNEYSNALLVKAKNKGRRSSNSCRNSGRQDDDTSIDLASGLYSSLYLQQHEQSSSSYSIISPENIGRHFLALFYRSIDNRLPPAKSKHGLDTLRKAFASLDRWVRKPEDEEKSNSRKRLRPDIDNGGDDNSIDDDHIESNEDGNHSDDKNGQKLMRKEPVEPAQKSSEGLGQNNNMGTTSNEQQLLDRKRDDGFVDKTIHDVSSFQTIGAKNNISQSLNHTCTTDQSKQIREDHAQENVDNDSHQRMCFLQNNQLVRASAESSSNQTETTLENGRGSLPNQEVGGSEDDITMNAISSQAKRGKENAQTVSYANAGLPKLHVVNKTTKDTVLEDKSPALNNSGSQDSTDTPNVSPSTIQAGYRRRSIRKCVVEDCPNKDGSCNLHGTLAKTCRIEGCDMFQIQGFDVCIKHGAKNRRECKAGDCAKQGIKEGFCTSHYHEFVKSTKASSEDGTTNESQAASEKAPKEPELFYAGLPKLHVATKTTKNTVLVDKSPALNSSGSHDATDTPNVSPSTIQAGYRRRSIRKCVVEFCPNRGGSCNLHGTLAKTCKIEGCDMFQIQGFDVCVKHGAKNPRECKVDDCAKQGIKEGFCTSHYHEFVKSTKTFSGDETNESQAASEKAPKEPELSLKRENRSELHSSTAPDDSQSEINPADNSREVLMYEGDAHQNNDAVDDELIDLTADSPVKAQPKKNASPPPSPPPTTIIRNPLPPPNPRANPFYDFRKIMFNADVILVNSEGNAIGTLSGCIRQHARPTLLVEFDQGYHLDGSGGSLDDAHCVDVRKRLSTWDPYWTIVEELGHRDVPCENGMTSVGTRTTTACISSNMSSSAKGVSSCALVEINFRQEIAHSRHADKDEKGRNVEGFRPWGVKWGKISRPDGSDSQTDSYRQGDRRLILRCLPLRRTAEDVKNRADVHLWPIGSFVQIKVKKNGINEQIVIRASQRKQQEHDHNKWLGNSHPLDLTRHIPDTNNPIEIKICSKEVIEGVSDEGEAMVLMNSYAVHAAVCEYTEPDVLYNQLTGKEVGGEVVMPKLSLRSAKKMLKECIANNTITIDSDEEDGWLSSEKDTDSDFLTFSLLCHASKTRIETPVRGRQCAHLQCFDLRNYLNTNNVVSAIRWRCPCCEKFVSVRDLVHCGFFQAMLDDLDDQIVPGVRDTVCVKSDGSWKLLEENKLRSTRSANGPSAAMDVDAVEFDERLYLPLEEPEVIEIL